jgi:UDP-glucose 6-dehydrogenase
MDRSLHPHCGRPCPVAASQPGDGTSRSFAVLSNPEFLAEGTAIAAAGHIT